MGDGTIRVENQHPFLNNERFIYRGDIARLAAPPGNIRCPLPGSCLHATNRWKVPGCAATAAGYGRAAIDGPDQAVEADSEPPWQVSCSTHRPVIPTAA